MRTGWKQSNATTSCLTSKKCCLRRAVENTRLWTNHREIIRKFSFFLFLSLSSSFFFKPALNEAQLNVFNYDRYVCLARKYPGETPHFRFNFPISRCLWIYSLRSLTVALINSRGRGRCIKDKSHATWFELEINQNVEKSMGSIMRK